jgi:glycosyltransferase involved in cell wall biosynthesis
MVPLSKPTVRRLAFLLPDMGGGGAERVALTLIEHFLARGCAVDLLLMRATGELLPLVPPEVEVTDFGAARVRDAIKPLSRYLRRVRPAAMQVSMWPLTAAAIVARQLAGTSTRLVTSDHAALSKQYGDRGLWHRQILKWSIRMLYPRADARVVVAGESAEDLAHLSGLPETEFEVVYNPVDPPEDAPGQADPECLWGGKGARILNVGRLNPQKNQALLLEAFARIQSDRDARLVILGDGDLRADLERRAQELGIADRVVMPGFQLAPGGYYRSADLFVLSSDYEGYPLVMIEAMHCGLPIVSTDCLSGPAEILDNGKFGTLVPCGDARLLAQAMAAALKHPDDPGRIKARAEELSANAADRYWELMLG